MPKSKLSKNGPVPASLKTYWRKEDSTGCLKVLTTWILGTLDPQILTNPISASTHVKTYFIDILGEDALSRDIIGAKISTWIHRTAVNAIKLQREFPLTEDDLDFIHQAPSDPLQLTAALINHKQPPWLIGFRNITGASVERTIIGTVIPAMGAGNNLPLWHPSYELGAAKIGILIAQLSSLTLDYVARQKIGGTNLNFFYAQQLPILPPEQFTKEDHAFLVPRILELTYTSHSMHLWATGLGHIGKPFSWDANRRATLRAELDAFIALKYGISRDELRYILNPADIKGENYPSETFAVLKRKEIATFGEYRTQRLVLEAYDRLQTSETFDVLDIDDTIDDMLPIRVPLPPLEQLPDEAWIRAEPNPRYDPSAALAAILKSTDKPMPPRTFRLAAVMMLNPHLLTPHLPEIKAAQWKRLVGQEAEPYSGNIVDLMPQIDLGWKEAVISHRGNGRLLEDLSNGTWARGVGLAEFETQTWPDGRAVFVLNALNALNWDTIINSLADESRNWVNHAEAA